MNRNDLTALNNLLSEIPTHKTLTAFDSKGINYYAIDLNSQAISNGETGELTTQVSGDSFSRDTLTPIIDCLNHNSFFPLIFKKRNESRYSPYSLNFRITYKCNIQCRHCYNSSNSKESICIDQSSALRAIKEGFDYGIRSMSITGGEPLLYPSLVIQMLKSAIELGYQAVSFKSNGFWGKSIKKTEEMYAEFNDIGFRPPIGGLEAV